MLNTEAVVSDLIPHKTLVGLFRSVHEQPSPAFSYATAHDLREQLIDADIAHSTSNPPVTRSTAERIFCLTKHTHYIHWNIENGIRGSHRYNNPDQSGLNFTGPADARDENVLNWMCGDYYELDFSDKTYQPRQSTLPGLIN